jgi:zinc transport system substrate-binding protein
VRRGRCTLLAVAGWLGLAGCGAPEAATPDVSLARDPSAPLDLHVVSYPLRYLAERVGGAQVRVTLPTPPGIDPADWLPEAEMVIAYQQADLILLNGAGYAGWVELASLPRRKLLDTSAGLADRLIERQGSVTHAHGTTGSHSHEGFEATTWLDPTLAIEQARVIGAALVKERPDAQQAFEQNLAGLERDLLALDARLAAAAAGIGETPLLFSHPVYGYLIRRYGLNGRSVHFEPDEAPDPADWRALGRLLEEHPARWMLWEGRPLAETRETLRGLGIESLVYDPAAGVPVEGDLLSVMNDNAAGLQTIGRSVVASRDDDTR